MSLWHRIFGSPEQQSKRISETTSSGEPVVGEPVHHERSAEFEQKRSSEIYDDDFPDEPSLPGETEVEHGEFEVRDKERGDEREGADEGEARRRRPRRRRRGGRGHRTDEQAQQPRRSSRPSRRPSGVSAQKRDEDDDFDDDDQDELIDIESDLEPVGDSQSPVFDEDDSDLESDLEGAPSEAGDDKTVPASHRSIPTWEEALGVIIEANIQARGERRRSSHSSSRSGSPRGRPRGGRRRKKPDS